MAKVVRLNADHPMVGAWIVGDDGSSVEYTVSAAAHGFNVVAVDRHDGETLLVSDVSWNHGALSFKVHVPSNGYRTEHVFRLRGDGTIDDEYTAHHRDTMIRKK